MKVKKIFQSLTLKDVCKTYELLLKEGLVSFPITKEGKNKIDILIYNIEGYSFGVAHYPTIEEKIIAYFYFIIKDHPFVDGNKRTAVLILMLLCYINKFQFNSKDYNLDELAVFVEQSDPGDYQGIIKKIAKEFID